MIVKGSTLTFQIGELIGDGIEYRVYAAKVVESGRQCLFQIATSAEHNGALERAAFFLARLRTESDRLETVYDRFKTDRRDKLNYHLSFPELVDSFLFAEQGNRRVNVLAFTFVDDITRLKPLTNIPRINKRIDQRTSVWMMGKLLKLLTFVHSVGITVGRLSTSTVLIEPDEHYVIVFDWTRATMHEGVPTSDEERTEIVRAACAVISVLGGNIEERSFPHDDRGDPRYVQHLLRLASGGDSSAAFAHREFYLLVDSIWERGFYPFTLLNL